MNFQNISLMKENGASNKLENDDLTLNTQDCDYKYLITRLKEISSVISLLEKTIFK